MNKEKQIEEMTEIIYQNTEFDTMIPECIASAEALYNAGYRKASEIAERVIDEMVKALKKFVDNDVSLHSPLPCCSVLWHFTDGIEQIESRLKKKYTESEDKE